MTPDSILLSVRPRYAQKILCGEKTVELRRVRPKVSPGDIIVMYVSSPRREVQAFLLVEEIFEAPPDALWATVRATAGVSKREYHQYFEGAAKGVGIAVRVIEDFREPVTLDELRAIAPGFSPPQSYRYVAGMAAGLRGLFASLWEKRRARFATT